jgi:hypothetical protein
MGEIKCSRCGETLVDYGVHKLGTGGVGGEWSYVIGDIVEIEQETPPVRIRFCSECGKIDLEVTEQTGAILLSRKGLKKCVKSGKRIPLASEECQYCGVEQIKKLSGQ